MTSSSTKNYLDQFRDRQQIALVGPLASQLPALSDPVIFVDGGSNRREGGIGIAVGDGDSFQGELDIYLDPQKDFSDLAFALSLVEENFRKIDLFGFTGGRRDHELLSLGEVFHYLGRRNQPCHANIDTMIDGYSSGSWQLEVQGTFSLIVFSPSVVSLSGSCKYPIAAGTTIHPVSSLGLSNEGAGTISFTTTAPIFVFHNR